VTIGQPVLRLGAILSDLLTVGHPGLHVRPIGPDLLAFRHASLRLMARLLALCHASLLAFDALRPCLLMLRARLALLGRSEALLVLHSRRGNRLALSGEATATATALARRSLGMTAGTTTAAATTDLIGLAVVSAMTAVRPRIRRGCDRQRGDAGCEKDPGHHNFSFERQQRPVRHTVPTVKRMEPAFYRTSVNLKLLDCSDS
jgi:hypothetical protein